MLKYSLLGVFLFLKIALVYAQANGAKICAENKIKHFQSANNFKINSRASGDTRIDVKYHKIELTIDDINQNIVGKVSTLFLVNSKTNACTFDLNQSLKVDSVIYLSEKLNFSQANNKLDLKFSKSIEKDQTIGIKIYYHGKPINIDFGSFVFDKHNNTDPLVASLSEPFGASYWWPCKDDLTDKIDSSDVWISMSPNFVSVSNGVLVDTLMEKNGLKTYKWHNSYPIAHYLISVACSNYTIYNTPFTYQNKTMPVVHYIYPEIFNSVKPELDKTTDMLKFFSDSYGEYPFIKEKYGHANFSFGGGMEHQTVSSMHPNALTESVIAHELAHQWFGDKITCKTWSDIFLNEAFASFSELLYAENKYGASKYQSLVNTNMSYAKKTNASIYIEDPNNVNLIFDYNLTYMKGSVVLHMLRGILGPEAFLKALNNYQKSNFAYNAATIDDFKTVVEVSSNLNLKYFFDEWIYGKSYPNYQFYWSVNDSSSVTAKINQNLKTSTPSFFTMPVQFKIEYQNGTESYETIMIDEASKTIKIPTKGSAKNVVFDPNNIILKELTSANIITGIEENTREITIYPNPCQNILNYKLDHDAILNAQIFSVDGKFMKQLGPKNEANISTLASGVYVLKIESANGIFSKEFVKK